MSYLDIRKLLMDLLKGSPIGRDEVIQDVRESIMAGECELGFDTICSWIFEDGLVISSSYFSELKEASRLLDHGGHHLDYLLPLIEAEGSPRSEGPDGNA